MWQKRCGSSGVAAAAGGSSGAGPAVGGQSEGRACVRAGAQTWRAHLRGYQRGRSGRASGRNRTWFFKGTTLGVWYSKVHGHGHGSWTRHSKITAKTCLYHLLLAYQLRQTQGIVPSSEVSSVIGEFIFYCVRQILWARLMRYIVWEDCGSRSRCGIPHRQVYPPIPAPKRETVPRSVTSLKPLSAL